MKFLKELGIELQYKGNNDSKISFSREIDYKFIDNDVEFRIRISRWDEMSIRINNLKTNERERLYFVFTDKTNEILRKFMNENSTYVESEDKPIEEELLHGITQNEYVINNDEVRSDIVNTCMKQLGH